MLYEVSAEGIARRVTTVKAANEAKDLQSTFAHNLFLLLGDQVDPDSPRRWLLVRGEMPVPDPRGSGRLTVNGVD